MAEKEIPEKENSEREIPKENEQEIKKEKEAKRYKWYKPRFPRRPSIENRYHLKPEDITRAVVLKPERLRQKPFWRNDTVQAWCLAGTTAKTKADWEYGTYSEYWIGFFDADAKAYAGQIRMDLSSYGGMCGYQIEQFFNQEDMETEDDVNVQEIVLSRINWLLDEEIIAIPGVKAPEIREVRRKEKKCISKQ